MTESIGCFRIQRIGFGQTVEIGPHTEEQR